VIILPIARPYVVTKSMLNVRQLVNLDVMNVALAGMKLWIIIALKADQSFVVKIIVVKKMLLHVQGDTNFSKMKKLEFAKVTCGPFTMKIIS
jgi:uncharacterized membrane protein